jgi:hypothetical protein
VKTFKDYLAEEEYAYDNPVKGDVFAFEILEEQLIETTVEGLIEDGVIVYADENAIAILENYGLLEQGQPGPHATDSISPIHSNVNKDRSADTDLEEGEIDEAEYRGRKVPLGKKMKGDVKKSKVYVRKPNGNIVKVEFGDPNMRIKKSNPKRRKSFRARHNCDNPGPRWKARYWSCRSW